MKTDAERMALIRQRTAQLQRQARARQMLLIDAGCMAAGVVIAGVVMRVQVFGPSPLMSGVLALTFGALAYLCFSALQKEKRLRPYEIALLFEMLLQILLFVVSEFIRDYTRFSLYYAVDILLTLTLVSFLPHILREEPHDLH